MQIEGISHVTFVVKSVERATQFFCQGLGATEVYDSRGRNFSLSREKFFLVGGVWVAVMKGAPPATPSYQHLAFKVAPEDLQQFETRLRAIGVAISPPRARVQGEGLSLYFHDYDNHLFELHTGTLIERLQTYAAPR